MPIRYQVDPGAGLIRVHVSGDIQPREVFEHLDRVAADPAYEPGMGGLVDARAMTRVPSMDECEVMAQAYGAAGRGRFAGSRRAVLVSSPVVFGAARQFAVAAERWGVEVRPFVDEGEALAWLEEAGPSPTKGVAG